ncbi:MAG: thioredoxin family protein [Solirubrobacterales bacterium]
MFGTLAMTLLLTGGPATSAGIKWERSFEEALKKAKATRKPILVDFWAEWCGWCHRLDKTTYVDPVVVRKADEFVAVKINTEGSRKEADVAIRYDVQSLPTILFLSPEGHPVHRLNGFQGPGQFPRTLDQALEVAKRILLLEAAIEKNPNDAAALAGLGRHLYEEESYEESRDLLERSVQGDRDEPAPSRRQARMMLAIIQNYDRKYAEAEGLLKDALNIKPTGEDQAKILFVLGRTYASWNRRDDAQKMMQRILRDYPGSPMAQKARETLVALDRKPRQ